MSRRTLLRGWRILVACSSCALPWLRDLVFSNKMLDKVVFAIASMVTIRYLASPILELPMPFILVSNPVSFSFERLWFTAVWKGTSKRLNILVYVFGPIRRLIELFDLEAQRTFELGWKALNGRQRHA
jgi:hypothetical protein